MRRFIVTHVILFSLLFFSNALYAANEELILDPILSLLLANRIAGSSVVHDGVIVIGEANYAEVVEVTFDVNGNTLLQLSGGLDSETQVGSLLFITVGADSRFPLGLAGKVVEITQNSPKIVKLAKVSYNDIFQESNFDFKSITLDASNFIDVIAPAAVQPSLVAPPPLPQDSSEHYYSFRDGAIVVGQSLNSSLQEYSLDVGDTVLLNIQLALNDLENSSSTQFSSYPNPGPNTGNFVITASLGNLKITDRTKFSSIGGLEQFYLRLDGDISYDVTFTGEVGVKFDDFSGAWNEVELEKRALLGQGASLNGLHSDEQLGKFPLVGLVYSIPCPPETCPVTTTGGDIDQANAFGVIVWLYLDLNGEYGVDDGAGNDGVITFARLSLARLSLGVSKSVDDLNVIRTLNRKAGSGDLLVAPEVNGSVAMDIKAGIITDLDFFLGGLRVANAGVDLAAKADMSFNGNVSYFTEGLSSPWYFMGNSTFSYTIGAGGIFDAAVDFGVGVTSSWEQPGGPTTYEYSIQLPTDTEMAQPGWHDAWYTQSGDYPQCDPYHPGECSTEQDCLDVGLYWYDNTCMSSPPTVVSAGGQVWMDRNLGASRVATAYNDTEAYGDLYQWGRGSDGHEKRDSGITSKLSSSDTPGHGDFILSDSGDPEHYNWRYPENNNLWQGVNGINNPCPSGFRLPTAAEWEIERASWSSNDRDGAFASPLKLTAAWYRYRKDGAIYGAGRGNYWSSSVYGHGASYLDLSSTDAFVFGYARAYGFSVRCIKD